MKYFYLLFFICLSAFSYSQSNVSPKEIKKRNYQEVIASDKDVKVNADEEPDIYPMYPNGLKGVRRHIKNMLFYPDIAGEYNIQGTVIVSFIVEKDGSIKHINVEKSVHEVLDSEAVKVIKKFRQWVPAYKDGNPVRVQYFVPVIFIIP